jgi:hypothetical protein
VNAIYGILWLGALLKWGDWRNWRLYYPTILFYLLGDLLYQYLLSDHYPMWKYSPQGLDDTIGLTHSHVSLSIMAIKYPATVLIYLSKFPKANLVKQALFIAFWVLIFAVNESIDIKAGLIQYYNGWGFHWSLFFNLVMFLLLKLHHHRPLAAWLLSLGFIVFLWNTFDVPSTVFR